MNPTSALSTFQRRVATSGTRPSVRWIAAACAGPALCLPLSAQVTQRMSVTTGGVQANSFSTTISVSADGRFVAFDGSSTNLVAGDTNNASDIFVRDRQSGTTERVSVSTGGAQANGPSIDASISADGRFVAFRSLASNLIAGDANGASDIFVRDRQLGTTECVSVASGGAQGNGHAYAPSISADGQRVAFVSPATNLVAGDTNAVPDVFLRDRANGTTVRVSVGAGGVQANDPSDFPAISANGLVVAFHGTATNLVAGGTNGLYHTFVRDLANGTTECLTIAGPLTGGGVYPTISADGRFVTFHSGASDIVANDTNFEDDVFLRDRQLGTTERVSLGTGGAQANSGSYDAWVSGDGRFVTFFSGASNLVAGDTNAIGDIFVRDRQLATTTRVSLSPAGGQSDAQSRYPTLSTDGRFVGFESEATNLVAGDTNSNQDVFVRDLDATGFTSVCDAGVAGVIACPCANAPSGLGRGCDNSSATGGALLSASGIAYLSLDSLVFTTSNEKPTATSIVMQGNALAASGLVFGQGVRCAGGTLKRLYTKTAVGGSITAPDFGAGDPTVSARSASLGDTLLPGQSRWYLVYYRDPIVLGGCPGASTFNATQTGRVDWSL